MPAAESIMTLIEVLWRWLRRLDSASMRAVARFASMLPGGTFFNSYRLLKA